MKRPSYLDNPFLRNALMLAPGIQNTTGNITVNPCDPFVEVRKQSFPSNGCTYQVVLINPKGSTRIISFAKSYEEAAVLAEIVQKTRQEIMDNLPQEVAA